MGDLGNGSVFKRRAIFVERQRDNFQQAERFRFVHQGGGRLEIDTAPKR